MADLRLFRDFVVMVKFARATQADSRTIAKVITVPTVRKPKLQTSMQLEKAHPCASCGVCCRTYIVPLCGHDIWRLSRNMHLDPSTFLVAWQEEEPSDDGFRIERGGPLFSVVLDKRSWIKDASPCTFLMRFSGGQDRCGVYEHRPVACRTYPMELLNRSARLRDDPLCPPDAWAPTEPSNPAWYSALTHAAMQYDIYRVVVGHWNSKVRLSDENVIYELADYYRYVLAAYDSLAKFDLDDQVVVNRAATWRSVVAHSVEADGSPSRVEHLPWQQHLDLVRKVLGALQCS